MQKWDYVFVEALWENGAWRPWMVNGEEVKDWKKADPLYAYANQLGQEGWELGAAPFTAHQVGAATIIKSADVERIRHDAARLFFKRPAQ